MTWQPLFYNSGNSLNLVDGLRGCLAREEKRGVYEKAFCIMMVGMCFLLGACGAEDPEDLFGSAEGSGG